MSENIWKNFSFKEDKQKSALEYLNELKPSLTEQTGGELTLETEAVDSYLETNPPKVVAIYKLFIVAPKLGNFRRKLLTVAEYSEKGRFPVDIYNHFLDDDKQSDISELDFMNKVTENLQCPIIKNTIENLYQQSKQHNK